MWLGDPGSRKMRDEREGTVWGESQTEVHSPGLPSVWGYTWPPLCAIYEHPRGKARSKAFLPVSAIVSQHALNFRLGRATSMGYVRFSLRLPHPEVDLYPGQAESKENQDKCQTTGMRGGERRQMENFTFQS